MACVFRKSFRVFVFCMSHDCESNRFCYILRVTVHSIRSCHIHEINYLSNISKFSLTNIIGMFDLDYNAIKPCNYAISKNTL